MLLEIGKALSFIMSILSLCALMVSAFFVPGSRWEERLVGSLLRIALAGCVCFASGLCSARRSAEVPLMRTLPVRLFCGRWREWRFCSSFCWYLEEYYVPLLWKNQPH